MTQLNMNNYLNEEENDKLNISTENIIEEIDDKQLYESKELNQIKEINIDGIIYKIWSIKWITPYLIKYIKETYPDGLVCPFNRIDFVIFDNKTGDIIPVEIQRTILNRNHFGHSQFEGAIRKQLEDNIENYEKCWFFLDEEYLKYLHNGIKRKDISINMDWLVLYMKDYKLRTFSINYDGVVKELTTKDFKFLEQISNTCMISYDSDNRILNRNKLKMFINVMKGYEFNQEEIDKYQKDYIENSDKKKSQASGDFFRKSKNIRCKLYGYILQSLNCLITINNCLDMDSTNRHDKYHATVLGIFEVIGHSCHGNTIKFTDKFDICKYFPGYLRQEKKWNFYRGNSIAANTFTDIINGVYKNNKSLMDY